jgi:hypothetical protein
MFAVPPADMDVNDQHQAILANQLPAELRILPLAQVADRMLEPA